MYFVDDLEDLKALYLQRLKDTPYALECIFIESILCFIDSSIKEGKKEVKK